MKPKHYLAIVMLSIYALGIVPISGCAWTAAHKSQIQATAGIVGKRAAIIALQVVIGAAKSQYDAGNKADYLDSLATGLRTYEGQIVSGDDIKAIVAAWTPDKPHWQEAGDRFAQLWDSNPPKSKAEVAAFLEAYASGLNNVAKSVR
jgi:hypothetical protein